MPNQEITKNAHTTVRNIDERCGDRSMVTFDSDSQSIICDNSANVYICNSKSNYIGEMLPVRAHKVATIGGRGHTPAGTGTVSWTLMDDKGKSHTYLVENVLYFPQSPINILSVTEFAKQLYDEEGTGIDTK